MGLRILIIIYLLTNSILFSQDVIVPIKLAVTDFSIKKGYEDLSNAFSDRLEIELMRENKIRVISRSKIAIILEETKLQLSGLTEESLIESGKLLGIEYLVTGSIAYREFELMGTIIPKFTSIQSKLINVETGEIVGFATVDDYHYASSIGYCAEKIAKQYLILLGCIAPNEDINAIK
ncbi:MAG: hypothetical protein HQ534_04335 [Armatimonadetes bacterium]|nr:hypothetical protein [Armatimonadota bacterium]